VASAEQLVSGGGWPMKRYTPPIVFIRALVHTTKAAPLACLLSIFYKIIEGLFPAFITSISIRLFDAVQEFLDGTVEIRKIYWIAALLLFGYAVKQIFYFISSITINGGVYEKVNNVSNEKVIEKCSQLPLIDYESSETLNKKLRALECVGREIFSQLYINAITMIMSAVSVITIISILAKYSTWFIFISILSVIPYFISRFIRGKEFYTLKWHQAKNERHKNYLWSLISDKQSIKEMRIMGFGDYITKRWMFYRDNVNEEMWKLTKKDAASLVICDFIRILGYGICIAISFMLTMNGNISVGVFGACIAAFTLVQNQTKSFLIEMGSIPARISCAKDYFDFIDLNSKFSYGILPKATGVEKIELNNVSFSYPNSDQKAISKLNMEISPGEKIAIIGENGSGKTTLTKLLMGIYEPSSGSVSLNGVNIQQIDRDSYQKLFSYIPQNFIHYSLTLRENVAISNFEELDNDLAIKQALNNANIGTDDILFELDANLGKEFNGVELSGGQWQKIAIARGIFRDKEVIIMDEPTSAIDPIAEAKILRVFLEIAKDKTAIIISHRTGLCKLVDNIAVMKAGELVEYGSHESLIRKDKEYARLFNAQKQWYS
jgi:ABC-type multidrug transport system fused ATPase/permease subunit